MHDRLYKWIFLQNKYGRMLQHLYSWSTSVVFVSSVGFLSSANSTVYTESKQNKNKQTTKKRKVPGFWPTKINKEFAKILNKEIHTT